MKIILLLLVFLCNILCIAQENVNIHIYDQDDKPIPFFTVENVKFKEIKYFADSLGHAIIPYINGMAYKIHSIGFADTIITLQGYEDLFLKFKSNNLLKEVVIEAPTFSTKITELKSDRVDQIDWYAALPDYNHEIGRIVIFDKNIWLQKTSFKLKSFYNLDFKSDVFVNIYKVNEKLETELNALKTKKPWYYQFSSSPDLVFSSHLNDNYDVTFEDNYLNFDLSRLHIYLEEGKYIITMELMASRTIGIRPYFSRQKECFTLISNSNAKRVGWSTDLGFNNKKYPNLIADFTYSEQIK